nr:MAG TPA: hypothetical protein [Caudoviricetes sp.]
MLCHANSPLFAYVSIVAHMTSKSKRFLGDSTESL